MIEILVKDTIVKEIDTSKAAIFMEANNTKGLSIVSRIYSFGLFDNNTNEILGVAQFCFPRTSKMQQKYSTELALLCFKDDVTVADGALKLINYFITLKKPADIFTYEDTIGELTKESFNWSLISDTEDKIYEWINPNLTYYTYKITASDSNKYYYGVRHLKWGKATFDDCLSDPYDGSGGGNKNNKFNNWKKKHKQFLQKEIMGIFPRMMDAYNHEKELIANSYVNSIDKLCLNSRPGGLQNPSYAVRRNWVNVQSCIEHGYVKHLGDSCATCAALKPVSIKKCTVEPERHGETKHQGDVCNRCNSESQIVVKECIRLPEEHGETKHRGEYCLRCLMKDNLQFEECINGCGFVIHYGGACATCTSRSAVNIKLCVKEPQKHGETKHQGDVCNRCNIEKTLNMQECKNGCGYVKHLGNTCATCTSRKSISVKLCEKMPEEHGEAKHQGSICCLCLKYKRNPIKLCEKEPLKHGETKHFGDKCATCLAGRVINLKECKIHGETKFKGSKCCRCSAALMAHKRFHGKSSKPDTCYLCA